MSARTRTSRPLRVATLFLAPAVGLTALLVPPPAVAVTATDGLEGRSFVSTSWWNTPLGAAPVDSHSGEYIKDSQNTAHSQNYLKLVVGGWGNPVYDAVASDPLYTIDATNYGPTVSVHIPANAMQQPTSDGEISIKDPSTNQVVGLWRASYNADTKKWTAAGVDRYYLDSGGITQGLSGGTKGNQGHRGVPSPYRAVHKDEVAAGAIKHRLELYWWATANTTPEGPKAYYPMNNAEQNKGGVVPEGIVIRIKPSVDLASKNLSPAALIVATALQNYGGVIGDNSGSGNNLKLQSNASWAGLLDKDSLKSIPWSDYEFVKGGYMP